MGLRANLVRVIEGDLPNSGSILGEPSPRWDALLGGRTGPDSWTQYGRKFGTTCVIVTNHWMEDAGFPSDMVVTTPTPTGAGVPMLKAQREGAQARGWWRTPVSGVMPNLRPGDIVIFNHNTATGKSGLHEGVVLSATPSADGQSLTIETADGGQKDAQGREAATRQIRTLAFQSGAHPIAFSAKFSSGWLDNWIAVGGDGPDDVFDRPSSSPVPESGGTGGTGGTAPRAPLTPVGGQGGAPSSMFDFQRPVLPAILLSVGTGVFIYGLYKVSASSKRKY